MSITVTPEAFTFVSYDNAVITEIAEQAAKDAGLPGDADVTVDVVESSPLGRVTVEGFEAGPPARITFHVEGGAFENLKAPRQFDEVRAKEILGRLFFRLADRLDPAFAFEGDADTLPVPRAVAWDAYAVGRLNNLGYTVSHDRWLYLFRNRHGFYDVVDNTFERLWSGERITWPEILALSTELKPDADIATAGRRSAPAR